MNNQTRIAIITGASRGMGRDTALRLAQRGISSIITYNTGRGEADEVVQAIRQAGAQAVALQLDVGQAASFEHFTANVRKALKFWARCASIIWLTTLAFPLPRRWPMERRSS